MRRFSIQLFKNQCFLMFVTSEMATKFKITIHETIWTKFKIIKLRFVVWKCRLYASVPNRFDFQFRFQSRYRRHRKFFVAFK